MTGTAPDATTFRAAHPYVTILDPPTFLRLLRPPPPPAAPATPNDRPDDEAP